jgi:molybdopterin converting factor small subunit
MTVTIHYYAMLRETAGKNTEQRQTYATTPRQLYAELTQAYGFSMPAANLRVAVNDALVPMDSPLCDGDTITFIPPVAGG